MPPIRPTDPSNRLTRTKLSALIAFLPIALVIASMIPSSWAISPAPPLPKDELVAFYNATAGDNWINNSGWLAPDTAICEWYGITCDSINGEAFLSGIDLPDNGLKGAIDGLDLLAYPLQRLDLSGNALSGGLDRLPIGVTVLDLSRNQLTGPLPSIYGQEPIYEIPDPTPPALNVLDLSNNEFSGSIPDDWRELELRILDISNNQLSGNIEYAFAAIGDQQAGELYLQDNQFRGTVPLEIIETRLWETDQPFSGGGLNLCWNALDISSPELIDYIDRHHVAGPGWQDCLNRERLAIDPTISGSWFSPARSGEGYSLMLLDSGQPLIYSFSYTPEGEQLWYFEVGRSGEQFFDWPNLLETRGDFGTGLRFADDTPALRNIARLRIDRLGPGTIHVERSVIDYSGCPQFDGLPPEDGEPVPLPCPVSPISDRSAQTQLSRLAGTSCDNQHENQWISGAWFSPERAGEGFVVEVLDDGRGVVYWFTYAADESGQQVWLTADAQFNDNILQIDSLLQPTGARAGRDFDSSELALEDWGDLTLSFSEEDQSTARFESQDTDFGSGEFTLERLARPMLAECD